MLNHIRAFILGAKEFRLSMTTHFNDLALCDAYDRGRDFAHMITFRHYEEV